MNFAPYMKKEISLKDVATCAVNWSQEDLEGLKELADSLSEFRGRQAPPKPELKRV